MHRHNVGQCAVTLSGVHLRPIIVKLDTLLARQVRALPVHRNKEEEGHAKWVDKCSHGRRVLKHLVFGRSAVDRVLVDVPSLAVVKL